MSHAVDWTLLDHAATEPVRVGDMVSTEAGGMPIYLVTALEAGRAWVATRLGAPAKPVSLDDFRWRARET